MERVAGLPIVLSQGWGCLQVVRQNFIDRPSSSTCVLPSGNHSSGSYQRETDPWQQRENCSCGVTVLPDGKRQVKVHASWGLGVIHLGNRAGA